MSQKRVVVVAGATGRAGRLIVQEARRRGFTVRALIVRPFDPPNPVGLDGEDIEIVEGDFFSIESLNKVMSGADYLISAIGSTKPFSSKEFEKIDVQGNKNLALAAKNQGIKQMVVISSIGAGNSKEAMTYIFRLMMGQVIKAKSRLEKEIKESGIDYTILRPGGYTKRPLSGKIVLGEGGKITGLVQREQVAKVCLDAITEPSMINRTFEVVDEAKVKEEHKQHIITI